MWVNVPSTACDSISFNSQEQLYPLTCAGWRELSNHYQNEHDSEEETGENCKKKLVTLTFDPWKSCFTTHLPFLSSNPKILKAFPKLFPPTRPRKAYVSWVFESPALILHIIALKMKPTKCPAKKWGKISKRRGEERKFWNFALHAWLNFAS